MAGTAAPATPAAIAVVDPFRNYNFKLEIRGISEAHFTECSGLGIRVNTIRYREGGSGQTVRTIPGAVEYADVTLRYGLTASRELFDWMMRTAKGDIDRRNLSIVVLGTTGATEVTRWNLANAFPCEWVGVAFDAMGRDLAIEQLKLSFDTIERA